MNLFAHAYLLLCLCPFVDVFAYLYEIYGTLLLFENNVSNLAASAISSHNTEPVRSNKSVRMKLSNTTGDWSLKKVDRGSLATQHVPPTDISELITPYYSQASLSRFILLSLILDV